MTAPALPVNVDTGIVRGHFVDDAGAPLVGLTVKFTARATYLQDATSTPDPTTIVMAPVTATTDLDGYLNGPAGVTLIATDDTDVSACGFSYQVGYSGHAAAAQLRAADIIVPAGTDRWLAEITPSPPAGDVGTALTAAEYAKQYAADAEVSATDAELAETVATANADAAANSARAAADSATAADADAESAQTAVLLSAQHADEAATSATDAANSATSALTSATDAAASAASAANSATDSATASVHAQDAATAATASQNAAAASATTANTAATTASTAATNAANSATNATNSADAAATSADEAETYSGTLLTPDPNHPDLYLMSVSGDGTVRPPVSLPSSLARKIRGGNITVKPSGLGWPGLWAEWDWANWIKPQVNRASLLGMNAVRIIGAPECVLKNPSGSLPKISQATYLARWAQLAEYCQTLGLWLYPCLVQKWDFIDVQTAGGGSAPWNFQDPAVTAVVTASAAACVKAPNVVGFDLFQEGDANTGLVLADILAMYAAVRTAAPKVPVTTSNSSGGFGSAAGFWADTTSLPYQAQNAVGGADFIDLHIYLDSVLPGDLDQYVQRVGKPLLIGEFGNSQDQTTVAITARYTAMTALHNRVGLLGSLAWALADQTTTPANMWGVWDNTGFSQPSFPSASGATPLSTTTGKRTAITNVLPRFNIADLPGIYRPGNLLSPVQARPRNSATGLGWIAGANSYLYAEPRGLGFSATAAGTTLAATTPATGTPVAAATYYKATVNVLAGAAARTISMNVDWYDSGGVYLTSAPAATGTDSTTIPLTLVTLVRSHTNAAYAVLIVKNTGSIAINEAHIVIDAELVLA